LKDFKAFGSFRQGASSEYFKRGDNSAVGNQAKSRFDAHVILCQWSAFWCPESGLKLTEVVRYRQSVNRKPLLLRRDAIFSKAYIRVTKHQ